MNYENPDFRIDNRESFNYRNEGPKTSSKNFVPALDNKKTILNMSEEI